MNNSHWETDETENNTDILKGILITNAVAFFSPILFIITLFVALIKGNFVQVSLLALGCLTVYILGLRYVWRSDKTVFIKLWWTFFPGITFLVGFGVWFLFLVSTRSRL